MSGHQEVVTMKVRIHGRVQGVGYRAWTAKSAKELELDGWVRNCADGTVEAEFHGPLEVVKRMIEECHKGPWAAKVTQVEPESVEGNPAKGFEIKDTV